VSSHIKTAASLAGGTPSPVAGEADGTLAPLFNEATSSLLAPNNLLASLSASQQTQQLPFSPAGLSSRYVNDPAQFATVLGTASDSLSTGLGQVDLGNIGALEDAANNAIAGASKSGSTQKQQLDAQQALINLQIAVQQASTMMNILGDMAKKAIDNSRLQ
jgi:hypothetical protein